MSASHPLQTLERRPTTALMRTCISFAGLALFCTATACSTTSLVEEECDTTSLQQVIDDPLRYAGMWFCGEGLVAQRGRVTRVMTSADEVNSYGAVVMVTSATRHRLGEITSEPEAYYLEAKIDPQAECFDPASSGFACIPYTRPIDFHIVRARRSQYMLASHTHHEQVTWGRFSTLEACEEARRGSEPGVGAICVTVDE